MKIGFVLLSDVVKPAPSTRVSILNMLPFLAQSGIQSHILFQSKDAGEWPDLSNFVETALAAQVDAVYFQKVRGPSVLAAIRDLKAYGIPTIYGVCDLVENEMAATADATIVISDYLRSLYDPRLQPSIFVVHDGIEDPDMMVAEYRHSRGSKMNPLKAALITSVEMTRLPMIGHPPDFLRTTVIGNYPPQPPLRQLKHHYWRYREQSGWIAKQNYLKDLIRHDFDKVHWSPEVVRHMLATADIGIIPIDMKDDFLSGLTVSSWQVKSENRLTLNMAAGLPVIAGPVPSYLDVIEHGENGFIAATRTEWLACFEALRDPDRRRIMGQKARSSVLKRFSKEEQARKLIAVLDRFRPLSSETRIAVPTQHRA